MRLLVAMVGVVCPSGRERSRLCILGSPPLSCRTSPPHGGRSAEASPSVHDIHHRSYHRVLVDRLSHAQKECHQGAASRSPPLWGRCPAGQRGFRRLHPFLNGQAELVAEHAAPAPSTPASPRRRPLPRNRHAHPPAGSQQLGLPGRAVGAACHHHAFCLQRPEDRQLGEGRHACGCGGAGGGDLASGSFSGSSLASIDDPPDFGAAGAAIGSGRQCGTDRLHRAAAALDGGDNLVDADGKAGADGRAGIRPAGAGAPGTTAKRVRLSPCISDNWRWPSCARRPPGLPRQTAPSAAYHRQKKAIRASPLTRSL